MSVPCAGIVVGDVIGGGCVGMKFQNELCEVPIAGFDDEGLTSLVSAYDASPVSAAQPKVPSVESWTPEAGTFACERS